MEEKWGKEQDGSEKQVSEALLHVDMDSRDTLENDTAHFRWCQLSAMGRKEASMTMQNPLLIFRIPPPTNGSLQPYPHQNPSSLSSQQWPHENVALCECELDTS